MKNLKIFLICFLCSLFVHSPVLTQVSKEDKKLIKKESRRLLKEIIASIDKSDFTESVTLIDSLLVIDPDNADGYLYKGISLAKTGDSLNAISTLEEGISKSPLSSRLRIYLSRIYLLQKDIDKAKNHIDSVIKIKPKEPEALYLRGLVYLQQGDTAQALENFETSIQKLLSGD